MKACGYNIILMTTNPVSETLLQMFYHLLAPVCPTGYFMRQLFPFTESEKAAMEAVAKHQKGNLIMFPAPLDFHFEIRYICQLPPPEPSPARVQGSSHLIHHLWKQSTKMM